mgnify:CR=1 FL=1
MKIHTIYFSATGGTQKVVKSIAQGICNTIKKNRDTEGENPEGTNRQILKFGSHCLEHNFTLPSGRETTPDIAPCNPYSDTSYFICLLLYTTLSQMKSEYIFQEFFLLLRLFDYQL